jgi:hypothetical protein
MPFPLTFRGIYVKNMAPMVDFHARFAREPALAK